MGKSTRASEFPDGILLFDKPEGPTSHDAVRMVRRSSRVRRVGHTGTLDPFASGLLLVCVGRATRLAEYFHLLPKTYRAVLALGVRTDTDDRTGRVIAASEAWRDLSEGDVRAAARDMVGELEQLPPVFSAKKVGGRRSYEAARRGERLELAPVSVSVHRLEVLGVRGPEVDLEVEVSTGTYVRALARDLGAVLGCEGHLSLLRRTCVGAFRVEDAAGPDDLVPGKPPPVGWLTPAAALEWLPVHELSPSEVRRIGVGRSIPAPARPQESDLPVPLVAGTRLVAVAREVAGELRPEKVFPE